MPLEALTLRRRAYVKALQLVAAGDRGRAHHRPCPTHHRHGKSTYIGATPSRNQRVVRMFRCGGDAAFVPVTSASFSSSRVGAFPSRPATARSPRAVPRLARMRVCRFQAAGWRVLDGWRPAGRSRERSRPASARFNDTFHAPSGSAGAVWDLPGVCQIHGHIRKMGREACAS